MTPAPTSSAAELTATLSSGRSLPLLGFGTYQLHGESGQQAIGWAVDAGIRHFDTATSYENEGDLGLALARSGVPRGELFLTSKLPLRCIGREREALERTLQQLQIERLDLWLMHWPVEGPGLVPSWEAMIQLRDAGLVADIGVSNFAVGQIDQIATATGVPPVVNQIRWNPFLYDADVARELAVRDVLISAYTPLRRARLDDAVLLAVASETGATPAQVIVRWHLRRSWSILFRSSARDRIAQNIDVDHVELTDEQMVRLDGRAGTYHFD
ncbi:aldo/keto reductase family protein [Jiangella asiatica]|uniref:Aldo/keto reductase n=1 Tax=Jiangella asiatica TaxID=2530372 RepID=A0A4V2Z0J1_9ACTN|nr:aldo/keto reductase [Jiangella asiatica]TDE01158.1 aldo/keto reductase [Jiangella asiatica]